MNLKKFPLWVTVFFAFSMVFQCSFMEKIGLVKPKECSQTVEGMSCIPSGEFIRGSDKHAANEKPSARIYLDAFYMDQYEVTNEDFQKCLSAGACQKCFKAGKCKGIRPNYGSIYMKPKQPIVGISWYTAKEYCEFMGKRLPTESEWEKAARGTDGRLFPWGDEKATCELAIIEEDGRKGCWEKRLPRVHRMTTRDVGLRAPNQYGLYDMAGNSWEYVEDWYSPSYEKCGEDCFGPNPKGPCAGEPSCKKFKSKKIVKGGSWWWPADYARSSFRRAHIPANMPEYHHFGFRCAKDHPKD